MIHLICTQLSCFSTCRLSNCLHKLQGTFTYSNRLICMLNHSKCVYKLTVHLALCTHTFAWVYTNQDHKLHLCGKYQQQTTKTSTELVGGHFWVALGLVYSNKTSDATGLGKSSRDSQSSNFLSLSALLTVRKITIYDEQTGWASTNLPSLEPNQCLGSQFKHASSGEGCHAWCPPLWHLSDPHTVSTQSKINGANSDWCTHLGLLYWATQLMPRPSPECRSCCPNQ